MLKRVVIDLGRHYKSVLRFLFPLVLTEEIANKGLNALEEAVEDQVRGD
jgi:4-aminobutyrate aminotransferase-like enzyme